MRHGDAVDREDSPGVPGVSSLVDREDPHGAAPGGSSCSTWRILLSHHPEAWEGILRPRVGILRPEGDPKAWGIRRNGILRPGLGS